VQCHPEISGATASRMPDRIINTTTHDEDKEAIQRIEDCKNRSPRQRRDKKMTQRKQKEIDAKGK
jgi:hypothetical protein